LILLGIASDEHREAILKNMRAQRKQLPKAFSFAQAK
jgi:DNA-directed RNA polymerase subunit H (RpoH/RPB5)